MPQPPRQSGKKTNMEQAREQYQQALQNFRSDLLSALWLWDMVAMRAAKSTTDYFTLDEHATPEQLAKIYVIGSV